MRVRLDPRIEARIHQKVNAGLYDDADEVIQEALHLLDQQEHHVERLRELIAEGENGEGFLFTPELVQAMKQDAERMAREGIEPDPDVCG